MFLSVFQYCQSQRDFISLLVEVTVINDMRELDVKSCFQLLTVETVKVMFIIQGGFPHLSAWSPSQSLK